MSFGISIGDIIKVCELAGRVYRNCRDCPGEYKTLTVQARSLTNLLSDIQDKFEKIPESKQQQFFDAYAPCIEVLEELDRLLLHYNGLDTKSKRAFDRLKFDPNTLRNLRERLVASVAMLNTFYTSLIHDVQVLIFEALENLERDYRGGHREGSIASIERLTSGDREAANEYDEAWHQIIHDLEDVGISQQQALSYREYIVDWLIKAVNEGRLLEDVTALPDIEPGESFSGLDILTVDSPTQDISPPSRAPPAIPRLPIAQTHSIATASFASQENSSPLLPRIPQDVDSDHASLYAGPQHSPHPVPPVHFNIPGAPHVAASSLLDTDVPPSYFEKGTAIEIDMEWTAHQAVAAWYRKDFFAAGKHIENQLAAVERGQRCTSSGSQPDRRVLTHLLGVCDSLAGNFQKAQQLFEKVFHGSFLNLQNLDEGDIAAARWLGDLCLQTQQHANAMLAYCVAYQGSVIRFGTTNQHTRQVATEIVLLDHWLDTFKRIEGSLSLNLDPTDILSSAEIVEKNKLLMDVKKSLFESDVSASTIPNPVLGWELPRYSVNFRPRDDLRLSEGFLLSPLISVDKWPFAYDPLFSPTDACQLHRYMNVLPLAKYFRPIYNRKIPRASFGDSKKLHYLTKRNIQWLVNAIEKGLAEMGIANAQNGVEPSIICCINQQRDGMAYTEGIEICFSKLPWREVYGIRVSGARWATRRVRQIEMKYNDEMTADFRDLVKGMLARAEAEEVTPS